MLRLETQSKIDTHIARSLYMTDKLRHALQAITNEISTEAGHKLFEPRRESRLGVTVFSWRGFQSINRHNDTTYIQRLLHDQAPASASSSILATVGSANIYRNASRAHIGLQIGSQILRAEHAAFCEVGQDLKYNTPEITKYSPHLSIGSFALANLMDYTLRNPNKSNPLQVAVDIMASHESELARVIELNPLRVDHYWQ